MEQNFKVNLNLAEQVLAKLNENGGLALPKVKQELIDSLHTRWLCAIALRDADQTTKVYDLLAVLVHLYPREWFVGINLVHETEVEFPLEILGFSKAFRAIKADAILAV